METSEKNKKILDTEYVYCLSNKSFSPNTLKVGWTRYNPTYRANQLYTTGLPTPFIIEFLVLTQQGRELESRIHNYLSRFRVNGSREFFNISLSELRNILTSKFSLKLVQLSDIIHQLPKITKSKYKKKPLYEYKPVTKSFSHKEDSNIDISQSESLELDDMFARFRYSPSLDIQSNNKISRFDEFSYRPISPIIQSEDKTEDKISRFDEFIYRPSTPEESINSMFSEFRYNPL